MTPAALYERQRELVRAGLLIAKGKKGPGAGVELSAESLAMLLISVLVTDSLSEVAVETADMARAKASPSEGTRDEMAEAKASKWKCPVTGKNTFRDALAAALEDRNLSERVEFVSVTKAVGAEIIFNLKNDFNAGGSLFTARHGWPDSENPRRQVSINIEGYVFSEIADILHSADDQLSEKKDV